MNSNMKVVIVVVLGVIMSMVLPHFMKINYETNVQSQSQKQTQGNQEKTETTEIAMATPDEAHPVTEETNPETIIVPSDEPVDTATPVEPVVYDGLTMNELVEKLNRSLKSTLSGTGESFAKYCLEMGVDPYLAVAIVLHETGCNYSCSTQVKKCNNVGGMKGSPSCNGTSYAKFNTLDDGIYSFVKNLKENYYDYGLTTPESMNKKYAASTTWAAKVKHYINKIKAA